MSPRRLTARTRAFRALGAGSIPAGDAFFDNPDSSNSQRNPQAVENTWITSAKLITPQGIQPGALAISGNRISGIESKKTHSRGLDFTAAYVAPGFIDLHVWGAPEAVSPAAARFGTTAFLTTVGPEPAPALLQEAQRRSRVAPALSGAACIGLHLEGPFVSRKRAGALPPRWMRPASVRELDDLDRATNGGIRLVTLAPELPGALAAVRWLVRRGRTASLGHSVATARQALAAVKAGARAVTHVFNAMPAFHHRKPGLLDVALTHPDVTTLVIPDGVHVSPSAFKLLVRVKGPERVALVTDSIRFQPWDKKLAGGAYHLRDGTLAGSALTMMRAVRNAVRFAGVSIADAVAMATRVPAALIGLSDSYGSLRVGARADLTVFDDHFRVLLTMVGGRIVYQHQANNG